MASALPHAFPPVAAGKNEHGALIGVNLGEADVGQDAQTAHGRDGLRGESSCNDAIPAWLALKLGIVDAGDGKCGASQSAIESNTKR